MSGLFACPQRVLRLSSTLLAGGVLLLVSGSAVAYGPGETLALGTRIGGHILIILGPTLFKIGYVMRLAALQRLQRQAGACCRPH